MLAVIMAGGRGTRVASLAAGLPKPMIPVLGKPVLQHQIEELKKAGFKKILIITGYLSEKIKDFFKNGEDYGVSIEYKTETEPLGTAGALFEWPLALEDDFLLLCGDVLFNVNFERFINFHYKNKALATLAAHPNSHPYDSAVLETRENGKVYGWLNKEDPRSYYKNLVNAGLHIISRELLHITKPASKKVDLDRDVLKPNISTGRIFAYNTPEYIKDMGAPERLMEVEEELRLGIPAIRNLSSGRKAVFLDRDGTLNELRPPASVTGELHFITGPDGMRLLPGAAAAVRLINESGFLAIVITNQPVIARGQCTLEDLDLIHKKLETDLGKEGAYINGLYFCPHHPHKGFAGEIPELKIDCDCRKPKPGMLLAAAKKYNIILSESWMIGDSRLDVEAGKNAGCKTAYIYSGSGVDPGAVGANITVKSLEEAVSVIFGKK
ncbi:MAG: HAD-IIIA family hydrolase [Spirochaetaceae bacterium]|jgi:histidinol-phosphate phosphatase family protein|nr:HAD-IIIA family hydrolase [Spirochaetaceae bacterium]